jgi:hypothetical protein
MKKVNHSKFIFVLVPSVNRANGKNIVLNIDLYNEIKRASRNNKSFFCLFSDLDNTNHGSLDKKLFNRLLKNSYNNKVVETINGKRLKDVMD